ncbi:MAG TPA: hypothetical protein VGI74_24220 [Streptosporangiaceae bacterium]
MTPATNPPAYLPHGVTPGPITRPTTNRLHGQTASPPLTTRPPTPHQPKDVISELATHLRNLGITATMYTAADHHRALLSLPHITIWTNGHTLTWTYHGQPTTWPAHDITTAAQVLAQLTHPRPPAPHHDPNTSPPHTSTR